MRVGRFISLRGEGIIEFVAVGVEGVDSVVSCGAGCSHGRHMTLQELTNSETITYRMMTLINTSLNSEQRVVEVGVGADGGQRALRSLLKGQVRGCGSYLYVAETIFVTESMLLFGIVGGAGFDGFLFILGENRTMILLYRRSTR